MRLQNLLKKLDDEQDVVIVLQGSDFVRTYEDIRDIPFEMLGHKVRNIQSVWTELGIPLMITIK